MTILSIANIKKIVPLLKKNPSILLRGDHGIGKSALAHYFGKLWGLPVIDRRLSQMTGGDLIGLPKLGERSTSFMPPDWFLAACDDPVLILLDELNRAQDDVIQGSFQIALDRECNGHKLHPQTRVFSAINMDSKYNVRMIDPALLSRFYVIDINFRVEDWLIWAKENGVHKTIIDHIMNDNEALMPPKSYDVSVQVATPRGWAMYSEAACDVLKQGEKEGYDHETLRLIAQGFVGHDAAIALIAHMKTVKVITGKQVLDGWKTSKVREEPGVDITDMSFMMGCLEKLADECREFHALGQKQADLPVDDKLKANHSKNLEQFMFDLPSEARPVFWQRLVQGITTVDEMQFVISSNKWLAPAICAAFGIEVGKAGVGQFPKASFKLDGENPFAPKKNAEIEEEELQAVDIEDVEQPTATKRAGNVFKNLLKK